MAKQMRAGLFTCAALALALLPACKKEKWYDATVEIDRISIVRYDDNKKPVTKDVEISFFECPGDQYEVLRGGEEFTECMNKHKVGDKVPVRLETYWDPDGHYAWRVHEVGGCKRPPDPNDEASFSMVQECEDLKVHGAKVGFRCDRVPKKALIEKCPWFKRH